MDKKKQYKQAYHIFRLGIRENWYLWDFDTEFERADISDSLAYWAMRSYTNNIDKEFTGWRNISRQQRFNWIKIAR